MASWRLIHHWHGDAGFHMSADEALLFLADRPVLRFYTWKPDALSLGYFQRVGDVPGSASGPAFCRRLTGGGAIHHADELTFSIAAPLSHDLYRGEVGASYVRVHRILARALLDFGVRAELRGTATLESEREGTGMCFHRSTAIDLVWDARKGVGSAQRRTRGRVLHHGSIKLGRTELEEGVACLRDHTPGIEAEELASTIGRVFATELSVELEPAELSDAERDRVHTRAGFFVSPEFVRRR